MKTLVITDNRSLDVFKSALADLPDAEFLGFMQPLLGLGPYKKVLIFLPQRAALSDTEWQDYLRWCREDVALKLGRDYPGELYLI